MPLSPAEQQKFIEVANFLRIGQPQLGKMIEVAGRLKDKKGPQLGAVPPGRKYDFVAFSKDVIRLYMTPEVKTCNTANLTAVQLLFTIVILYIILHYFYDDWRIYIQHALSELQRSIRMI